MSFAAYVPLAAAILNGALLMFVLRAGVQSASKFPYLIWGASITVWNFGTFQMFRVATPEAALDWARFLQIGVIFLPISLLQLCLQICGVRIRGLVAASYAAGVLFAATLFTRLFVATVRDAGYAWYGVGGPAFWVFAVIYSALTILTLVFLWRAKATATRFRHGQIRSLLWATGILIAGGNNDILPILGVYTYPILDVPIFPIGSLCAIFYGILVGYSVLQHQLLDIRLGLSRFAAHAMRIGFLFLTGFVLMLIVALLAPAGSITHLAFWAALGVLLTAGFIASRFMPKLLGAGPESLEHRLLGDHFEYQDRVRAFIGDCRWHSEFTPLFDDLHTLLLNTLNVSSYDLVLRDEARRSYSVARAYPERSDLPISDLYSDSPAFQVFLAGKQTHLLLDPDYRGGISDLERKAREQLKPFNATVVFPLLVENSPLGLLAIGQKNGGRAFTQTDIQLLSELSLNIALVIHQISLKNQLVQSRELDLLGRMSQGMAHDLNNLTTPVWTLLQLLSEGVSPDVLRADLAPIAIRNLQTMRDYIKEALFFSENLRPDYQSHRLDVLVQEVIELAMANKRKGKDIRYTLQSGDAVLVEMDQVLIRRLLANVISNAVDASKQTDAIEVELIRLVKTDPDRDWFRIRVTDHGSGIAAENLDRIFQPYFSTKKTGDENRGFGLGLAICRKIAALHGGNLVVSSEVGKGTVVNLDLPNHQKAPKAPLQPALATSTP